MNLSDRQVIAAQFRNENDATEAIRNLRDAGFRSDQIGCSYDTSDEDIVQPGFGEDSGALGRDVSSTSGSQHRERGFMDKVREFFSGEEGYENRDTGVGDGRYNEGPRVGPTLTIPDRYNDRLSSGAAIVTVHVDDDRINEAESILTRSGGEIDRDFYRDSMALNTSSSDTDIAPTSSRMDSDLANRDLSDRSLDRDRDRDLVGNRTTQGRQINLLSEVLRVNKQRVETGEVRLRKEVRTENQTIEVPVTHEELVIERIPGGQNATGEQIGTNDEIRVPLSEERVDVEKSNVVREQVRVGKKEVQNTETVSEEVRHEDLKVDDETKKIDVGSDKPKRRKIA